MKKHVLSFLALFVVIFSSPVNAQTPVQIAGTGINGYNGNNLPALSTELNNPTGIAFDKKGVIYFSDANNELVRKIDASGNIVTVAGVTGVGGYNGDGIAATSSELSSPTAIAFDTAGNLYIADQGNERIRKVDTFGIITTVAGTGVAGYNGDGILAVSAEIYSPSGIAFDSAGNMYITDQNEPRVRKVNTNGYISTVIGNGTQGYTGDNGIDTSAQMDAPYGICFDNIGNMYVTDIGNGTVRKVSTAGIITTVAGTGVSGYNGAGIPATTAELLVPEGVVLDDAGNLYIADGANNRIGEVNSKGIIITLVSDTGQIIIPNLGFETAINRDNCGKLYFIDGGNAVIWKLGIPDTGGSINPPSPFICSGQSVTLVASDNGTTYTWSPAIGLSSTTGDSVVARPLVTTTYTVTAYTGGCVTTSQSVITLIPSLPIIIQPQSPVVCTGQNVMLIASPSGSGYSWSPSSTLSSSSGDSVFATPLVTTTYTVTGTDSLGCQATNSDVVTVIPSPNKPSFSQHNDTLISSSRNDNQWYRNDTLLINDTSQNLIISVLGKYWVVVNNEANGCSTSSDTMTISSLTGVNQLTVNSGQWTVFPNPTSGQFTIKFNSPQTNYLAEVYNVLGEKIYQSILKFPLGDLGVINLSAQPDGMYFIYLKSGEGVEVGKILLTK